VLNGLSSKPTEVADSSKIFSDKTSLSLAFYLVKNSSNILWTIFFLLLLYHCTTNVASLILLSCWDLILNSSFDAEHPTGWCHCPFLKCLIDRLLFPLLTPSHPS
jgi:hypothetical protein